MKLPQKAFWILLALLPLPFTKATTDPVLSLRTLWLALTVLVGNVALLQASGTNRQIAKFPRVIVLAGGAFLVSSLLSAARAVCPTEALMPILRFALGLNVLFLAVTLAPSGTRERDLVRNAFLGVAFVVALAGILEILGMNLIPGGMSPHSFLANRNLLSMFLLLSLPFSCEGTDTTTMVIPPIAYNSSGSTKGRVFRTMAVAERGLVWYQSIRVQDCATGEFLVHSMGNTGLDAEGELTSYSLPPSLSSIHSALKDPESAQTYAHLYTNNYGFAPLHEELVIENRGTGTRRVAVRRVDDLDMPANTKFGLWDSHGGSWVDTRPRTITLSAGESVTLQAMADFGKSVDGFYQTMTSPPVANAIVTGNGIRINVTAPYGVGYDVDLYSINGRRLQTISASGSTTAFLNSDNRLCHGMVIAIVRFKTPKRLAGKYEAFKLIVK